MPGQAFDLVDSWFEHGATLASSDHDFARFAHLRSMDPVAG